MSPVGNEQTIQTVIDLFGKYRLLTFDRDLMEKGSLCQYEQRGRVGERCPRRSQMY